MTSIFSPLGQQLSTVEQEADYLEEVFSRKPDQRLAVDNAQLDRNELPLDNRYVKDADNENIINGFNNLPNITIRPRPAHDNVGLLQTARQSFRNELNKYNVPLLRDDQGRIIGQNSRRQEKHTIDNLKETIDRYIASKTGKDVVDIAG